MAALQPTSTWSSRCGSAPRCHAPRLWNGCRALRTCSSRPACATPRSTSQPPATHGVVVCGTGAAAAYDAAELTWALLLGLAAKRLRRRARRRPRRRRWQTTVGTSTRTGARSGVVGLGRLGGRVAAYGRASGWTWWPGAPTSPTSGAPRWGYVEPTTSTVSSRSPTSSPLHLVLSDRAPRPDQGGHGLRTRYADGVALVEQDRGPLCDEDALLEAVPPVSSAVPRSTSSVRSRCPPTARCAPSGSHRDAAHRLRHCRGVRRALHRGGRGRARPPRRQPRSGCWPEGGRSGRGARVGARSVDPGQQRHQHQRGEEAQRLEAEHQTGVCSRGQRDRDDGVQPAGSGREVGVDRGDVGAARPSPSRCRRR